MGVAISQPLINTLANIPENIKHSITDKAKSLGFIAVGFSKADILEEESARLRTWLNNGYDADMKWIEKGFDKRRDIKLIMEDAKSVISLGFNYYIPVEHDPTRPKISRYAWGKDYHKVLKIKQKELIEFIKETTPRTMGALPLLQKEGMNLRAYVDDGPVMDKAWAVRAGIGWMGKHTNVINPTYGSWFFICSIITNMEFESYDAPVTDLCGSCTLCISSCPTGAIIDEYKLDSNLCISYHTIENKGEIPENINLDGWVFGCDVCQDVCPYNSPKFNFTTPEESFYPKNALYSSPLKRGTEGDSGGFKTKAELEQIAEEEFNTIFADSPVKRTKFAGWKRNLEKINVV